MRQALVSSTTFLLSVGVLFLLVQFLGAPVKGESLERGVVYRSQADVDLDTGSIQGQIVDRRGSPLRGVRVLATGPEPIERFRVAQFEGPESPVAETLSDKHGNFVLKGLTPGAARIWAGGGRWLFAMTGVVEVRAAHEAHGVVIGLEPRPARK